MSSLAVLSLDEVLVQSDVVSLHLLLTDETKGLLSRERIAAMKPGVILVNTARGALVDEEAMIEALRSGHIRPGLDVFAVEPMPAGHILTTYGRCAIGFGLFPRDVRAFKGHALFEPRLAPPTADHVGLALGSLRRDNQGERLSQIPIQIVAP